MKAQNKLIRQATKADLTRIAEIETFNYRLNFYPIVKQLSKERGEQFYFKELNIFEKVEDYKNELDTIRVYEDNEVIKGFIKLNKQSQIVEIQKLFVEIPFQHQGIGTELINYIIKNQSAIRYEVWALEENIKAISFYKKHGFKLTTERELIDGTYSNLVKLELNSISNITTQVSLKESIKNLDNIKDYTNQINKIANKLSKESNDIWLRLRLNNIKEQAERIENTIESIQTQLENIHTID